MAHSARSLVFLVGLVVTLAGCGGAGGDEEQTQIVADTMTSVFPDTTYSVVTDAVLCPDDGRRVTVVASFIVPEVPEDSVSAVRDYWAGRGDLTERVTRSRWSESAMAGSIVTFTQSQDGLTAELLAFANDCDARKRDRVTEQIDPTTSD